MKRAVIFSILIVVLVSLITVLRFNSFSVKENKADAVVDDGSLIQGRIVPGLIAHQACSDQLALTANNGHTYALFKGSRSNAATFSDSTFLGKNVELKVERGFQETGVVCEAYSCGCMAKTLTFSEIVIK